MSSWRSIFIYILTLSFMTMKIYAFLLAPTSRISFRSYSEVHKNVIRSIRCRHSGLHHSTKSSLDEPAISDNKTNRFSSLDIDSSSKYFEFDSVEKKLYTWWESSGYFKPSSDTNKKPFVIPMPPPNVTGYLHMGHAMFVALQDIMIRFQRMRGKAALWLPGTDHAGIATQLLVERALIAEGKSRRELGRDAFLERVWKWKEEKGSYITDQMRKLGASADWSRECFTLEPKMSDAVTEAFVLLHEKGLVYRGDYMVNWSPNLQTAVSDLEVEYTDEIGKLYYFKYELADGSGYIPVATTRPETILGDTAVCVHPDDARYQQYIGKSVRVPLLGREIPVIADDYVDKEFGTGALKITPAHDINDYELGKKYNLPSITVINKDGTINNMGGDSYNGLDRFDCRNKLWADMETAQLTLKVEAHSQRVPRSQRGGEVIEPLVSAQWFIRMDNMAERAVNAVRQGDLKIVPERFDKVWYNWLENVKDWCVSRQLWWGHRIPVYYVVGGAPSDYFVARSLEDAYAAARKKFGDDVKLIQDEDVLDTWFSSGLWPFSTVGWPQSLTTATAASTDMSDFQRFYPAHLMETGYDILFFWVARMVMLGLEFTDKVPFETIYLHGLVRDAQGRKMSKTTGNVIDPIDTIATVGADALRYALVTGSTPGQDIPLSQEKIEASRNFVNKLWNVGKYIQNTIDSAAATSALLPWNKVTAEELSAMPLVEKWILSRVNSVAVTTAMLLEKHSFGEAGKLIYELIWDDLADWYIEASKARLRDRDSLQAAVARKALLYSWDSALRMLHPFMPFITETLWQQIQTSKVAEVETTVNSPAPVPSVMLAAWPSMADQELCVDAAAETTFKSLQSLVKAVRNARAEYNVDPGRKISAKVVAREEILHSFETEKAVIALLARVEESQLSFVSYIPLVPGAVSDATKDEKSVHIVIEEGLEVYLPLSGLIDKDKELQRLRRLSEKLKKEVDVLQGRLNSKGFAEKAKPEVIKEVTDALADRSAQLASIEKNIIDLSL